MMGVTCLKRCHCFEENFLAPANLLKTAGILGSDSFLAFALCVNLFFSGVAAVVKCYACILLSSCSMTRVIIVVILLDASEYDILSPGFLCGHSYIVCFSSPQIK